MAILGLGYAGLPLAVAFGKVMPTVGRNLSSRKIESFRKPMDLSGSVCGADMHAAEWLTFASDPAELASAEFFIDSARKPLVHACEIGGAPLGGGIGGGTVPRHHLDRVRQHMLLVPRVALGRVAALYERVVAAGVHGVSSIRVAEAAKVIENTQRDLNIASMNGPAVIFNLVGEAKRRRVGGVAFVTTSLGQS